MLLNLGEENKVLLTHYGRAVYLASNRNEYQKCLGGAPPHRHL
jgi:hypothetical protein